MTDRHGDGNGNGYRTRGCFGNGVQSSSGWVANTPEQRRRGDNAHEIRQLGQKVNFPLRVEQLRKTLRELEAEMVLIYGPTKLNHGDTLHHRYRNAILEVIDAYCMLDKRSKRGQAKGAKFVRAKV